MNARGRSPWDSSQRWASAATPRLSSKPSAAISSLTEQRRSSRARAGGAARPPDLGGRRYRPALAVPDTATWVAVITGGTAVASGLVGLLGGVLFEERRASAEAAARKEERAGSAEERRRTIYTDFLRVSHRFHQDGTGTRPFTPDEARAWFDDFEERLIEARIFGAQDAAKGAQRLADVREKSMGLVESGERVVEPSTGATPPRPSWEAVEDEFMEAWESFIEAARRDVGP